MSVRETNERCKDKLETMFWTTGTAQMFDSLLSFVNVAVDRNDDERRACGETFQSLQSLSCNLRVEA